MVMKVSNINPVAIRNNIIVTKPDNNRVEHPVIKELGHFTPDFRVQIPQTYKKISEEELSNGLKLHSYKLANGYKVTIVPMEGSPATVKNYVNVGALNETNNIKGISHFLEHMAFNGTIGNNGYTKLNPGDSFKNVDKLGGWTNASTSLAVTDYVNSTPLLEEKDLEEQIKIIAAMTENLALTPEMIEKEKGPVCSEINMILDDPITIVHDQTIRTLFNINSSADELIAGSTRHIQNLTRKDVKDYYDKYYTPDNMNLVITGDVNPDEVIKLVAKNFHSKKVSKDNAYHEKLSPINKTIRKDIISDKTTSTHTMVGFAGPQNNDTKSKIITEILQEYIQSVNSGFRKDLKPYHTETYLGVEKISNKQYAPSMLFLELNTVENNSEQALKVLYSKLASLKSPNNKELNNIKKRLSNDFENKLDYSSFVNNVIGSSVLNNDIEYITNYDKILASITKEDIDNYIKKYINLDKAAITVIHPETTVETIQENYKKANGLNFKGHRQPVNMDKISTTELKNNFKMGFVETKNNGIKYEIRLNFPINKDINIAAYEVLSDILYRGTLSKTEEEFDAIQEEKDISVTAHLASNGILIRGKSDINNLSETIEYTKELINTPRITQKEFEDAVNRIKDRLSCHKDSADSLYDTYLGDRIAHATSKEKIEKAIETLTFDDVQKLHKHILETSCGTIAMNVPTKHKEVKEIAIEEFSKLNLVKPYDFYKENTYKEIVSPVVLTKASNNSQADIKQIYHYEHSEDLKEQLTLNLMNSILSSSSSIGLFNNLREKEQLAYSVFSNTSKIGNTGELSLNILTTTDNKEIGEESFENLQKAINGFHRQINCLKNSEYTDEDLENAKKGFKAGLLETEGVPSKIMVLTDGLNSKHGINVDNKAMEIIDSITREDIQNMANKVFKNKPIYSIVATEDTLNSNREYLENLKNI